MKKDEVKVGGVYAAKVSDKVVPVRIEREHPNGGWLGTNQETGKEVRIKSAQRLRGPWPASAEASAGRRGEGVGGESKPEGEPGHGKGKKVAPRAPKGTDGGKPTPRKEAPVVKAKTSGLDAAAKVLEEAGEPLDCRTIVARAFEKGYWRSDGKTPAATIYAAILREVQKKGDGARFRKIARGKFGLAR